MKSAAYGSIFLLLACSAAPPPDAPAPEAASTTAPAASPPSGDESGSEAAGSVDAAPTAQPDKVIGPEKGPLELPVSDLSVTTLLDKPVRFVSTGRHGRIGAVIIEGDKLVPYRFEGGKWAALALDGNNEIASDPANHLEMFFGRDDRPRLMGYRAAADGHEIIYLRYIGSQWKLAPVEIGRLSGKPKTPLFGVLGWDDPEIVCKVDDICLVKSRMGWNEVPVTVKPSSFQRAFHGTGYVLDGQQLFKTTKKAFVAAADPGPWKAPGRFWVDKDGTAVVADPKGDQLHTWSGGGWSTTPSPIAGPMDVAGSKADRLVVGKGGIAHVGSNGPARVGPSQAYGFVIQNEDGTFLVAGESGIVRVGPKK